jgi:hypothetical protein
MKRLEEDNCNNVPKRTKLHAERQREYTEPHKNLSAEYMHIYRKHKTQETQRHKHLLQLTLHHLQFYAIIIKPMNTFQGILLVIHLVMPETYVIDYDI